MTAGCLDGQRWGRKAGTVPLLLDVSTRLDDKKARVGKHKERKVQVLEWTCVLFIADEPKEIKYYLTH